MTITPGSAAADDRHRFALALVQALAGEGRLQGGLEFGQPYSGSAVQVGLYYVEDTSAEVLLDPKLAMARIRSATAGEGRRARICRSASFDWIEQDLRMHCIHHFMLQPCNTLLSIEGLLGHEDLRSRAPVPAWGSISFHPGPRSWQRDFDGQSCSSMDTMLAQALGNIRAALQPVDMASRRRALGKIERRIGNIRSRFLPEGEQA